MATLIKGVDLAGADGVVHALGGGMPIQLNRMQALGARVSLPVDQDGMGQLGADLDGARRSNRSY